MTNITAKSYIIGIIVALTFLILILIDPILSCDIPSPIVRFFIDALILFVVTLIFSHIIFVE